MTLLPKDFLEWVLWGPWRGAAFPRSELLRAAQNTYKAQAQSTPDTSRLLAAARPLCRGLVPRGSSEMTWTTAYGPRGITGFDRLPWEACHRHKRPTQRPVARRPAPSFHLVPDGSLVCVTAAIITEGGQGQRGSPPRKEMHLRTCFAGVTRGSAGKEHCTAGPISNLPPLISASR